MNRGEEKGQTRVELTLDSNHQLPVPHGLSFPLDQRDIELKELRRLCATASGEQKAHLEAEIRKLEKGSESPTHRNGPKKNAARPWSARPVSRQQGSHVMKTIPESRQHVRPLSSKMRGVSGISSLLNGEADLQALHRSRPRHSRGDLSSAASEASEESVDLFADHPSADEVTELDINRLTATCFDSRHPPRHCVDRSPETFFSASGMCPQILCVKFRRSVNLRRVSVVCSGVRSMRLRWKTGDAWRSQMQTLSRGAPHQATTEFAFDPSREGRSETNEVLVEIVAAFAAFCRVRHLGFVEASGRKSRPSLDYDESSPVHGPKSPPRLCPP